MPEQSDLGISVYLDKRNKNEKRNTVYLTVKPLLLVNSCFALSDLHQSCFITLAWIFGKLMWPIDGAMRSVCSWFLKTHTHTQKCAVAVVCA